MAAVGLLCIVFVALAYFMNVSLMLFRTGSMEPTIPTGSVAVVQEIPASEVEVGDVLTVDRDGRLPVTHRVTSVAPGEGSDERVITMQGDANDREDQAPYTITEGHLVLFSVPGLAQPINQLNNPYILAGITLGASALVGWAFWPREGRARREGKDSHGPSETEQTEEGSEKMKRESSHTLSVIALAGLVGSALVASPTPAQAQDGSSAEVETEVLESTYLQLTSISAPSLMSGLAPGAAVRWDVGVAADAPEDQPGMVTTGVSAQGELPMDVTVYACDVSWNDDPTGTGPLEEACDTGSSVVAEQQEIPRDGEVQWLDEFSTDDERWFRMEFSVPGTLSNDFQSTATSVRFHAAAEGEELSAPPPGEEPDPGDEPDPGEDPETGPPPAEEEQPGEDEDEQVDDDGLAITGFSSLWLLLLACGALAVGAYLAWRSRRREGGLA